MLGIPKNTIFDVKRLIGRKFSEQIVQDDIKLWPFEVEEGVDEKPMIKVEFKGDTKHYHPEQISAMILGKLKESAETFTGKKVNNAIITVPACFNDAQKQSTKDAATIAGLDVIRILSEPTAAAIAFGLDKKYDYIRKILTFDIGGGTFGVSLLTLEDGIFEVRGTSGDNHLGGEDFDQRLVDFCVKDFLIKSHIDISKNHRALRRLRSQCEKAKWILSSAVNASIECESLAEDEDYICNISRDKFEELWDDLFNKFIALVEQILDMSGDSKHDIHDVVLIGGSTRIPKIQDLLSDFFNGK